MFFMGERGFHLWCRQNQPMAALLNVPIDQRFERINIHCAIFKWRHFNAGIEPFNMIRSSELF